MANRSPGKHAAPRAPRSLRLLACAPRIVGAAALALATLGALTVSPGSLASHASADGGAVAAKVLAGPVPASGMVARQVAARESRVSRDSSRQALEDRAGTEVRSPGGAQAKEANAELAKLAASAEQAAELIAKNAWHLPVDRGVYRLTGQFGQCGSLWAHCHTGLDFAAPEGTPVRAVANGVVTETAWAGAYGNRTVMTLEDGTELWYCHQSSFGVEVGDQVVGGQTIGSVGSTGNSTGPHLHLEVRPGGGDAVDPVRALAVHGVAP